MNNSIEKNRIMRLENAMHLFILKYGILCKKNGCNFVYRNEVGEMSTRKDFIFFLSFVLSTIRSSSFRFFYLFRCNYNRLIVAFNANLFHMNLFFPFAFLTKSRLKHYKLYRVMSFMKSLLKFCFGNKNVTFLECKQSEHERLKKKMKNENPCSNAFSMSIFEVSMIRKEKKKEKDKH